MKNNQRKGERKRRESSRGVNSFLQNLRVVIIVFMLDLARALLNGKDFLVKKYSNKIMQKEVKTYFKAITIVLLAIFLISQVFAANPGHVASSISPGQFESGNYTFPDSLHIENILNVTDALWVDPITSRVGIGTSTPDGKLDIESGGVYLSEISAPDTPNSGKGVVYAKAGRLYYKNDAGEEFDITLNESAGFGAWQSVSEDTNYYASTDGFVLGLVIGTAQESGQQRIEGYTGPLGEGTLRGYAAITGHVNAQWPIGFANSFTMPVKKGEYYNVTKVDIVGTLSSTRTYYWISGIGAGSNYWNKSGSDIYYDEGKVGIGTASPSTLFHTYQNDALDSTAGLTIEQDGTGDAVLRYYLTGGQYYSMGIDNSNADRFIIAGSQGLGGSSYLAIDNSGKVGIGTTTPTDTLNVEGTFNATRSGGAGGTEVDNSGNVIIRLG